MHNVLKEFKETIGPTTAINWYTRESLIYRLVHHAFRTFDWNLIEKLRYFIGCLYMQLTREHSLFVKRYRENPVITLYRGQLMNSFQEHVAMNFINACEPSYNEMRLLFKIIINTDLKGTQPYADITHLSTYVHEEEVLIMSGATFIVTDILLNAQKKVPIVLMELCPNQQEYDFNGVDGDSFQVIPELFDLAENRHRWLRPRLNSNEAHPDSIDNQKAKVINEFTKWRRHLVALMHDFVPQTFYWIDFYCIYQYDIGPAIPLLPLWVACCEQFLRIETPDYSDRAWCRLEPLLFYVFQFANHHTIIRLDFKYSSTNFCYGK
ncbi:unnamed protein product [Rotaria magnacalcarata]